jgi:hypothetical protein
MIHTLWEVHMVVVVEHKEDQEECFPEMVLVAL